MKPDPWWLAIADRAYGLALHLYPRAFREQWGAQMRQTMRDRWRACVQEDRGAFSSVFALFPDLVASAGQEHLHAFGEEAAMKRVLLGSVLVLSAGLFAIQGRISTRVAGWQEARTWIAVETAYRNELREAASASPRPDIRALAWTLEDSTTPPPALHKASEAAPGAEAIGRDRLADFLAAARCEDSSMLARLEANEPGNGAVWAVAASCARRADRPGTARQALLRLGRSDRYDSRSGELLAASTALLKQVPEPFVFLSDNSPTAPDFLGNMLWSAHEPEIQAFAHACGREPIKADASLMPGCRAAAEVLSRADSAWVRRFGEAWLARFDGRPLDRTAHRERDSAQQQALARWWALDDAARAARMTAGGGEVQLLSD